jgi:DNA-binding MltR family transcriptional regulator
LKKKFPRSPEEIALRREQYIAAIGRESDRGCVLVGGAVLDEGLEQLLRAEMPDDPKIVKDLVNPLFMHPGPLATFWARSRIAFSLGYLSKETFDDLEVIRDIRNSFAHGYGPASLTETGTAAAISRLKSAERAVAVARKPANAQKLLAAAAAATPSTDIVKPTVERVRWALATGWIMSGLETATAFYEQRRAADAHGKPYVV